MKKTRTSKNLHLNELNEILFVNRNRVIKEKTNNKRLYSTKPVINQSSSITQNLILSSNDNTPTKIFQKKNNMKIKISPSKATIKPRWPKVTKAIWPFTVKRNEPIELKKSRINSANPSEKYHNFNTIKWLNQKYSDSVKEKSIFSLLPNKGKRIIPEGESEKNKRHRKIIEYLESFRGPKAREKNVEINPKYFYNKQTFERIKKLKDIFLMFDKEGKQRMVLKEMVKLFKNNGIEIDINSIKDLFFKNIELTREKNLPINLLYLDFYQFMNFALSREQDFRKFIREIKKKNKNRKIKDKNGNNNGSSEKKKEKKEIYFPMNFNSTLDYFMRKEQQRNSINMVEDAIKEMDKMMKIENEELNETNNLLNEDINVDIDKKSNNANFLSSSKSNNKKLTKSFNYLENSNVKDINFSHLIEEFSNLFGINNSKRDLDEYLMVNKKKIKSAKIRNFEKNFNKKFKNMTFTEETKKKLRNDIIKDLNIDNFKKFNNLRIAVEATKEQIKNIKYYDKNKNGLIDEDRKTLDMIDTRNIINRNDYLVKSPQKIFQLSNPTFFENFDNSLLINAYLNKKNNKYRYRNKRRIFKEKKYKFTSYENNKKPIYNFYYGSPKLINTTKKRSKYDYVPSELFN